MTTRSTPTHPTWREWTGLVLVALPLFMMATDFTVLFLAMPAVTADLAPSTTQMLWVMHGSAFVTAGLVITMGRLTDKVGRRRLLFLAMALYGAASAMAAFAPNTETLLAGRVLLGISSAAATPAAFSLVRSMFSTARHYGIAFAVVIGTFSAGAALGPPIGGVLLEHFWWGSVFLINVPAAALVLLAGRWLLPCPQATNGASIDALSVLQSLAAVILVIFGLQEIADQGFSMWYLLAVVAGVVLGMLFVRRQRRLKDPLLDLGLFRIRALRISALVLILSNLAFLAGDLVLVQYLQIVNGVPMAQLGLLLAIPGIAAIVGTAVTPTLNRLLHPSHVVATGIIVATAGLGVIIAAIPLAPQLTSLFILGNSIVALGVGPVMVLGAQLIVSSAPEDRTGSAVAVQDVSEKLGGAVGMAFIGSLAMAVFSRMVIASSPGDVSEADMDAATQSPGGAVAIAERIGGVTGNELLQSVQYAWSMGTLAAHVAGFLIGVAAVVLVLKGLRGVELPADTGEPSNGSARPESEPPPAITPAEPAINEEPLTEEGRTRS